MDVSTTEVSMYQGVKVFSATKARERLALGEEVTKWLQEVKPDVCDTVVRQSSDKEYHCLSIIVFYDNGAHKTHATT